MLLLLFASFTFCFLLRIRKEMKHISCCACWWWWWWKIKKNARKPHTKTICEKENSLQMVCCLALKLFVFNLAVMLFSVHRYLFPSSICSFGLVPWQLITFNWFTSFALIIQNDSLRKYTFCAREKSASQFIRIFLIEKDAEQKMLFDQSKSKYHIENFGLWNCWIFSALGSYSNETIFSGAFSLSVQTNVPHHTVGYGP